jgi:hypothetical protein
MTIQFASISLSPTAARLFDAVNASNENELEIEIKGIPREDLESVFKEKNDLGMNVFEYAVHSMNRKTINAIVYILPNRILHPLLNKRDNEQNRSFFTKIKNFHFVNDLFFQSTLRYLEIHYDHPPFFKEARFINPLVQELAQLIQTRNHVQLMSKLDLIEEDKLSEIFNCKDTEKEINLLSFAAHLSNCTAVDVICSTLNISTLMQVLLLTDKCGWTAFHHLAIMRDKGVRYKIMKKKTGIDTKKIGDFFCECPSMLRKYTKDAPHKFRAVTRTNDTGLHLYFRNGDPGERVEHRLGFQDFKEQFGHLLTSIPKTFQVIPYGKRKYFRHQWIKGPFHQGNKLNLIDNYLKRILEEKGEKRLSLATVTHTDDGRRIPRGIQLGLGVESRKAFKEKELVTLYGGELFTPWDSFKSSSSLYQYNNMDGVHYRSYGSSALHSAPNIEFNEQRSCLGNVFVLIKAVEPIPAKTKLCIDYGIRYFKSRQISPFEIRPKAFQKIRSHPDPKKGLKETQYVYLKDFEEELTE